MQGWKSPIIIKKKNYRVHSNLQDQMQGWKSPMIIKKKNYKPNSKLRDQMQGWKSQQKIDNDNDNSQNILQMIKRLGGKEIK